MYAAYKAATEHTGQPTVILAKTIKGWTLGSHFEGRNSTHQMKKLTKDDLIGFRDRLHLDIPDAALDETLPPYYHPGEDSDELAYMHERRRALGGYLPDAAYAVGAARAAGRPGLRRDQARLRQAEGRHHDGVRPAAQGPAQGQGDRLAVRADHPRRGAHVRHGLAVPDAEDLLPARPALHVGRPRADAVLQGGHEGRHPARGHQRGRLDRVLHRGRVVVRHARRADDPDLHLLLDVRLPAHRRRRSGRPATR